MRGARERAFRGGLAGLVEAIFTGRNDDLNGDIPLFTMLSKQHRLSLLRDVASGLLTANGPLPPETPWHYAG